MFPGKSDGTVRIIARHIYRTRGGEVVIIMRLNPKWGNVYQGVFRDDPKGDIWHWMPSGKYLHAVGRENRKHTLDLVKDMGVDR